MCPYNLSWACIVWTYIELCRRTCLHTRKPVHLQRLCRSSCSISLTFLSPLFWQSTVFCCFIKKLIITFLISTFYFYSTYLYSYVHVNNDSITLSKCSTCNLHTCIYMYVSYLALLLFSIAPFAILNKLNATQLFLFIKVASPLCTVHFKQTRK